MRFLEYILEKRKPKDNAIESALNAKELSILDRGAKDPESIEIIDKIIKSNGPMIYAFITPKVKDAIKIGYTESGVDKRIDQWRKIYDDANDKLELLGCWRADEISESLGRVFFMDYAVHHRVDTKGFKNINSKDFVKYIASHITDLQSVHVSKEFFRKYKDLSDNQKEELSSQIIEDIINQMKEDIRNNTNIDFTLYTFDDEGNASRKRSDVVFKSPDTYSPTDLQKDAITNGVNALKAGKKKLLLAAVMRFGKTHTTYQIVKKMKRGAKIVLVTSAKADVREAWRSDINHKDFVNDFVFVEFNDQYTYNITYKSDIDGMLHTKVTPMVDDSTGVNIIDTLYDSGKTIVIFSTLQDLSGSLEKLKHKHIGVFDRRFDLMVVDETHYGSHSNRHGRVTKLGQDNIIMDGDDTDIDISGDQEVKDIVKTLNVDYDALLQMSGTPYYILASNEMIDPDAEIISRVSYTDMIEARDKWEADHIEEKESANPYFGVPTLHKIGLRLNSASLKIIKDSPLSSSMNVLFKVKDGKFTHESAIKELVKGIFGDKNDPTCGILNSERTGGHNSCKHTIVVMPMVEQCHVMKKLLQETIGKDREIIAIVGNDKYTPDVKNISELNARLSELDANAYNKDAKDQPNKSIILTVVKYLTGVTMPLVDSMVYMKNSSSPQEYDQSVFRICSRNVRNVQSGNDNRKVNLKNNVYLIDVNTSNMMNMVVNNAVMQAAAEGDTSTEKVKDLLQRTIDTMPMYTDEFIGGLAGRLHEVDTDDLLKVYTNFNSNKGINDIVTDDIDKFNALFFNDSFRNAISGINVIGDKHKVGADLTDKLKNDGTDTISSTDINDIDIKNDENVHLPIKDFIKDKSLKKEAMLAKEKFATIVKRMMFANLLLDEPKISVPAFLKVADEDPIKTILNYFDIKKHDIEKLWDKMNDNYRGELNFVLSKINLLVTSNKDKKNLDKILTGISDLGRLTKSEVITPPEIVEKMLSKLTKKDFDDAESILIVNSKSGEFLRAIYDKYGKDAANKCRIVASSGPTMFVLKKIIKELGLDDYILLDIGDTNGNGKYEVTDFLDVDNNELLSMNEEITNRQKRK